MKTKLVLLLCLAIASALPVFADNLLTDPGFNIVGPSGSSTSLSGINHGTNSAAANWGQWNNDATLTTTALVNTPSPTGDNTVLQITTNGGDSGVYQLFAPGNQTGEVASVWVYVLSGQVGIGFVNTNGTYALSPTTDSVGQWVLLNASGAGNSGEFVIYSFGGAASFYIDNASIQAVPEPGSLLTFGSGLLGLAGLVRRKFSA